jgi:tol-pal system protein YbgF
MKLHKLAAWAFVPFFLMTGCNGVPGSSSSVQREIDALKMEVADLRDRGRLGDLRGGGADVAELGRLRTDVQRLTENVESAGMGGLTLRQQLEYISARLDRLEKKAGFKPLDAAVVSTGPVPVVSGRPSSTGDAVPVSPYQSQTSDPYAADGASGSPPAYAPPAARSPYDEGKDLYDRKDYAAAIAQFKTYLTAEPKGSNASASQFYIGESLYAQQKYEEAILEYQKVIQQFPKSSHVPTALLKQGISFQSIGDKDSSKLLYQKIVRDYPKSYAAGVAKERLKTI